MSLKVGINGFGRIGRLVFRIAEADPDIEVVAINNPSDLECAAYLAKYDSCHGVCYEEARATDNSFIFDGHEIPAFQDRDIKNLDWKSVDAEIVLETTGHFKDNASNQAHIDNGASKVVISAPGKDVDNTIVMGVNQETYDKATQHIVSNASCTTNCLAPFAKVLNDNFGIVRGYMNTVHAYTNDQKILDVHHKDFRRSRAAAVSMIPTTTGAAKAVGLVIPELAGQPDGMATRVPTPTGSMVDLVAELGKETTAEEINTAMKAAAEGPMKGILQYCTDPIVSTDIIDNPYSSIFDSGLTNVMGGTGNFVKCISWYDNEWGYSNRVVDLAKYMCA
ncbi:MAG: type I glyceraldehyde-3-phosphate dehydrogenase [Coriobacteriales bacterium]|nr:type I glyceraldehyde-3-phosphate dehydrogenase [Coriobacteriales bacterium]